MTMTKRERAVVDAAILWAMCPDAGGYRDGPAVEDTCENLVEMVRRYLSDWTTESPPHPYHWTVEQMRAAVQPGAARE
jgi:hypothetical protein